MCIVMWLMSSCASSFVDVCVLCFFYLLFSTLLARFESALMNCFVCYAIAVCCWSIKRVHLIGTIIILISKHWHLSLNYLDVWFEWTNIHKILLCSTDCHLKKKKIMVSYSKESIWISINAIHIHSRIQIQKCTEFITSVSSSWLVKWLEHFSFMLQMNWWVFMYFFCTEQKEIYVKNTLAILWTLIKLNTLM